jgi:hypothetical protein
VAARNRHLTPASSLLAHHSSPYLGLEEHVLLGRSLIGSEGAREVGGVEACLARMQGNDGVRANERRDGYQGK